MERDVPRQPHLLLVEPEPAARERFAEWLQRSGYEVISVPNALQAIAQLRTRPPEVLLTALHLPSTPACELLDVVRRVDPLNQVLVHAGEASVDVAIERALIRRLQLARLLDRQADAASAVRTASLHQNLSERELLILTYLCQGADIRAIAGQVDLVEKTLRNTLTAIYRKLNVTGRSQAMAYGHRHGIGRSPVPMDA